ncbi:hypothetical protein O9992_27105 [Vibrio lentus]|nr:hypothetical protein [Vibrio lentus]
MNNKFILGIADDVCGGSNKCKWAADSGFLLRRQSVLPGVDDAGKVL